MGSVVVVVKSPAVDHPAGLLQTQEQFSVQKFIAELTGDPVYELNRLLDRNSTLHVRGAGLFFVTQLLSAAHPGEYMVLVADPNTALGHLGFALDADGERVYLYDKLSNGGVLIDSVVFGTQLTDKSVGRTGREHKWTLTQPSFGSANISEPLDNP